MRNYRGSKSRKNARMAVAINAVQGENGTIHLIDPKDDNMESVDVGPEDLFNDFSDTITE